ncbi:hypothetical protein [Caballeronia sp. Lep1P3]|uniref:hypothetical protein n=1 Tax=Caballeronia sp. Lep1P3 TaxID=2878150 RepID=UPI001FD5EDBC|nr:hypothetical protein [Caballeronia sp. Lep1P3]
MNRAASAYGLGQWAAMGEARQRCHTEYEQSPPFALVMLVFVAAMLGGAYVSCTFGSIASGWIAGVGILAALGAVIDRWFTGAAVLERRLNARARARHHALRKCALGCRLGPQPFDASVTPTREWTSMSAYRRHPRAKARPPR